MQARRESTSLPRRVLGLLYWGLAGASIGFGVVTLLSIGPIVWWLALGLLAFGLIHLQRRGLWAAIVGFGALPAPLLAATRHVETRGEVYYACPLDVLQNSRCAFPVDGPTLARYLWLVALGGLLLGLIVEVAGIATHSIDRPSVGSPTETRSLPKGRVQEILFWCFVGGVFGGGLSDWRASVYQCSC